LFIGPLLEQELRHERDDRRARDGLAVADGKRRVLVGARSDALVHEGVPRNLGHRAEHALVGDAFAAQRIDHAKPRALGGHADAVARAHHFPIHFATRSICPALVRST
jgi:hypothetical protein